MNSLFIPAFTLDINRSGDTTELARLLYYYPTTYYFIKACYRFITNKDGDTAMTLLSKYYRQAEPTLILIKPEWSISYP